MKNRYVATAIGSALASAALALAIFFSAAPTVVLADDYRPISLNWDISAPGANTDAIIDISWKAEDTCRVSVQVVTSSIVNLMVKRGAVEKALGLNSNTALKAGALYAFDVPGMKYGDIVNFQIETNGVIDKLDVSALRATR